MGKIKRLTIISGALLAISSIGFSSIPLSFDSPLSDLQESIDSLNTLAQEVWEDQFQALTSYENTRTQRDHNDILKSINADTNLIDRGEKELIFGLRTATIKAIGVALEAKGINEKQYNEALAYVNKLSCYEELAPLFINYIKISGDGWEKLKTKSDEKRKEYRRITIFRNRWLIASIVIQSIGLILGLVNISRTAS